MLYSPVVVTEWKEAPWQNLLLTRGLNMKLPFCMTTPAAYSIRKKKKKSAKNVCCSPLLAPPLANVDKAFFPGTNPSLY